jgi:hypothetical protein
MNCHAEPHEMLALDKPGVTTLLQTMLGATEDGDKRKENSKKAKPNKE